MPGPQDKHSQEIATIRALTKVTGLTRTQLRDRLHDFAEQKRTEDLTKSAQAIPGFRPNPQLPESTLQAFPGQTKLQSPQREQADKTIQSVVVTNSVVVGATLMTQQTYCACAPV